MKTKQPKLERERVNWALPSGLLADIKEIAAELYSTGGKVNLTAEQLLRDAVARYKAQQEANDNA